MKLTPGDLKNWAWYRHGILRVLEKTGDTYLPEHVFHRVVSGSAWIWDIEKLGFLVLTQEYDHDGLVLFVWVIYCEPGMAVGKKDEIYGALETLAREAKAVRLRYQSPLRGWEREKFFKQVAIVFEHEVNHG